MFHLDALENPLKSGDTKKPQYYEADLLDSLKIGSSADESSVKPYQQALLPHVRKAYQVSIQRCLMVMCLL
jgi:hypothetical protein